MCGLVTREDLIGALKGNGGATPVLEFMTRDVPTVPENACLDNVFEQLRRHGQRIVGVVDPQQRLVGYITAENLAELVMIQSTRASRAEGAAPA
jgi:CBS domain-containing protein